MQHAILREFYDQAGGIISEAELMEKFGIDRIAIEKNIAALKAEGYPISTLSGNSYRLEFNRSLILSENLAEILQTRFIGHEFRYYPRVDSTNAVARRLLQAELLPAGTIVAAGEQTQGRGRRSHHWESLWGGLWFSVVLTPRLRLEQTALLSLVCAVAVGQAIKTFLPGLNLSLKWPNDILLNNRKLVGILLEATGKTDKVEYVVAGIGINTNVRRDALPLGLRAQINSLLEEYGREVDNTALLALVARSLEERYDDFLERGFKHILPAFKAHCSHLGKLVRIQTGNRIIEGINTDIDEYGNLIVDVGGRTEKITTGDVCLVE